MCLLYAFDSLPVRGRRFLRGWLAGLVVAAIGLVQAQEAGTFEKSSLAWRTALHFDPGAQAPLRSLIDLYQKAGRLAELTRLYLTHVEQYPQDEGAAVVLARLLLETESPGAGALLEAARRRHPQSALLARAWHEWLARRHQPGALEALRQAVELETQVPARRAQWLGELLRLAAAAGREDLVRDCLAVLVLQGALAPGQHVSWARRCLEAGLAGAALRVLEGLDMAVLGGEEAVEARFTLARVLLARGDRAKAADQASMLMGMLGVDHGRRAEALRLCWQTEDEARRKARLEASARAWQSAPGDEAAALTHGSLLMLAGQVEEALRVWRRTLETTPESRLLEERVLQEMEARRLEEPMLDFLLARMRAQPQREDLRQQHARLLLRMGRVQEGLAAMQGLLEGRADAEKTAAWLQAARWLRRQNLFSEAAAVLAAGLETAAGRWDLRKELAELLYLQKRDDEARRLLEAQDAKAMTTEMRLEAAPFLIQHQLWDVARRLLEEGLRGQTGGFDLRLLLARVESLAGRSGAAAQHLALCREECDTEARYAAWLAAAWERAEALEQTRDLIEAERARLWPAEGRPWEVASLSQLAVLAARVSESKLKTEAEALLRRALAEPSLPQSVRQPLRQLLIALLEGSPERRRELEQEIQAALAQSGAEAAGLSVEDLRLRLLLMYQEAGRADLARQTLAGLKVDACQDADLIQRGIHAAKLLGERSSAQSLARRLVLLQPQERAHWLGWTTLLAESGQEAELRQALREMAAHAADWHLDDQAQALLSQHLCASAWRSIVPVLADPMADSAAAEACLVELESLEKQPARRAWLAWARGLLARRQGDTARLAEARAALSREGEWIELPDGVVLSKAEALRLLEEAGPPAAAAVGRTPGDHSRSGSLAWAFQPREGAVLVRWELSPDGARVLAQDQFGRLYALDRVSGRLLWQTRIATPPVPVARSAATMGEALTQPMEWSLAAECVVVRTEAALCALSWADGRVLWQAAPQGMGRLAAAAGLVLCWQPEQGTVDALEAATGRLRWSRWLPDLGRPPTSSPSQPQWLAAGLQVDGARALVWGSGTALLRVEDGAVVWKAGAGSRPLSFPLELDAMPETKVRAAFASGSGLNLSSSLAWALPGYPGAFGGGVGGGSPWLQWGAEGMRWLHGDSVWLSGLGGGVMRASVLGFPLPPGAAPASVLRFSRSGTPLGMAGRGLIMASSSGLVRAEPGGQVTPLLEIRSGRDLSPARHPMPAAALDGSVVLVADMEQAQAVEALTGTLLWQQPWQGRAAELMKLGRASLAGWQSMRWSSSGMTLYDGNSSSLVIDWRALACGGDLIAPAGLWGLVCLRAEGLAAKP